MSLSKHKISQANLVEIPNGSQFKFAIVVSQWNKNITDTILIGRPRVEFGDSRALILNRKIKLIM